ncbi:glycosyltransferase [Patescibacteria group bacterium]
MSKPKKVAICHYRVGGTDGVSLEIEKRKKILEKNGCEVKLIAGERSIGADHVIRELEWDDGVTPVIKENSFLYFKRTDLTDEEIKAKMKETSYAIKEKLNFIQKKEKFDFVLIHNIFSFGGHIAAAKAFAKWIEKFELPTLATHHDFYWEREEYFAPRSEYLQNYMQKFMPPKSPYIKHVVINSITQKKLRKRNGIVASVLPDVFDFDQKQWERDAFNKDFREEFDIRPNDLVVLQATRIIPRKAIEVAIDFVKELQKNISKLRGKQIYNSKNLTTRSNVVFIMAGYVEEEKRVYLFRLRTKAHMENVELKSISRHIEAERRIKRGIKKYSIWDAFVYADLVTFPSVWEGWGNQFIETVFARKPIVVFEYPVFEQDIKPEGYEFISLGNKLSGKDRHELYKIPQQNIEKATQEMIEWLLDKNTKKKLEKNFKIGNKFHDDKVLESFLVKQLKLKNS